MINDKVRMYLLPPLFNAAVRAGASIMNIYKNLDDYDISLKDDKTPITLADRLAHKTIREYLGRTRIPILSEEGREMRYDERRNWELYWLVDPLDGTVEFIKGKQRIYREYRPDGEQRLHGGGHLCPLFRKRCTSPGGIRVPTSRGILRRMPPPNTPTTRSSRAGGSCRSKRGGAPPPAGGRVAVAPDARNGGAYRPPARSASRSGDHRAGEFLQILPAGRGKGRLLCPHDAYVRVGHCRGRVDPRRSGRPHRTLPDDRELLYNEEDLRNPWFVCRSKHCKI